MAYTPPGLPVAASFPNAAGFPTPYADPRVGANPYAGSSSPGQTPSYVPPSSAAAMSAMGLAASTRMTPEEATAQSETALAKLALVNPQLAQQLLEQRTGQEGGGIFGFLKDVAGTILSPALSMGGRLLEIIGRTSHIVPQWFDPDDEGSWFEDIGQAMSGEDKTNWNEVFQNAGILENAGWLRATLGFGLDIATDPLTYATLGAGAGVTAATKASTTARLLVTRGPIAERLAGALGKSLDETSALLKKAWNTAGGATNNIADIRKFADGGADEIMGAIATSNASEVRQLVGDAFELGAVGYQKAYGRTLKSFLNRADETIKLSSGTVVKSSQVRPMFEEVARAGNFVNYGDGAWGAAKAAAGSLGGLRFRYALPFTRFRYLSPMVPQTWRLGFGSVGRFGAGLGGFKVIGKLGPEAETLFATRGWKGITELAEQGNELASTIVSHTRAGRSPFVRSAFYSASENVGRMTAHLSPGARLFRRGLGYYFYRNGIKGADDLRRRLVNDMFYAVSDDKTGAEVRRDLFTRYDRLYGKKGTAAATARAGRKYVDYFGHTDIPHSTVQVRNGDLDRWFWQSTPERRAAFANRGNEVPGVGVVGNEEYARQADTLADMKKVLTEVPQDAQVMLDDMVATEAFGKTTLERHGVDVGDSAIPVDQARVLHPGDRGLLGERPGELAQDFDLEVPEGIPSYRSANETGVTPEYVIAHEDLGTKGVRFDLSGGGRTNRTAKAQLRVHRVVDVNLEDFEDATEATAETIISGDATLPQILKSVDEAFDKGGAAMAKQLNPLLDNHILREDWELAARAEIATEALKRGPNPPDAVRYFRNGQPESLVVFDPSKVHVISDSAPRLLPQGGYFRRVLAAPIRARLGGEAIKREARLFSSPRELELSFRRETRGMTLEEAERHIRAKINVDNDRFAGITIRDDEDVFEWDVLKGHEEYIGYLGDSYFAVAAGRITSRMLQLGSLVPGQFGAVAKASRVKFEMPSARLRQLAIADKNLQNAAVKLNQRMSVEEQRTAKTLLDAHNRIATVIAYLDAGLTAEDIPAVQLSNAVDGVVTSSARLQEVVSEVEAQLAKRTKALDERSAVTQAVEEQLHVAEFRDLDEFIDSKSAAAFLRETEPGAFEEEVVKTLKPKDATVLTRRLDDARQLNEAFPVPGHPGVWKIEDTLRLGDLEFPRTTYFVVDDAGQVISARTASAGGAVVAQTLESHARQGYGLRAILAHWADEGVKDFADIKRMVGANTLSESAVGLNKKAARRILARYGFPDPADIQDLLKRGELFVGPDNSILTKQLGIRKGGRKVYSAEDIANDALEIEELRRDLNDLRAGLQRTPEAASQERAAARFAKAAERMDAAVAKSLARSERAATERGGVVARARQRVAEAASEVNRMQAELNGHWSEMKPSVYFDLPPEGGLAGLRQVQIPGLGGIYAHPYVAEELDYVFRGRPVGHLMTLWREFLLGPWKRWATYRNPGFHVRNNFGAWFNNVMGGVDALDHEFSRKVNMARGGFGSGPGAKWAAMPVSPADWKRYEFATVEGLDGGLGTVTYGDVAEMLSDMGIGRANTTSVALTMGGEGLRDRARGTVGNTLKKIDTGLRNVGGMTEDFYRVAAWAGGMRHLSGDLYGARAFTMVRHGDYSDLTETEDWIRDLVPFYKWMRTNVPYQFRMLAENPGFLAGVDKAQTFVYDVQGLNRYEEERTQPDWLKRGFVLPIPKGVPFIGSDDATNYMVFDLPYSDLYNGARDYLSSGLPMIRNVVESFGIQQSVFTGAPLGERMVPLSGLFANPVLEPLFAALPFAQRGPDGQVYIPDTVDNVLAGIPVYSRFRNWMLADPTRVQNRTHTFTSALLGVGLRPEDATATELAFYYDELLPAIERMRSMGYQIPTAEDLEAAGTYITGYGSQPTATELFPSGVAGQIPAEIHNA